MVLAKNGWRRSWKAAGVSLALVVTPLFAGGCNDKADRKDDQKSKPAKSAEPQIEVTPIPIAEMNEKQGDVYNVSGIVPLDDSRFLVVDNNTNDALLELRLTPDGKQAAPITLLPLKGLEEDAVDDMEDLALAEEGGRRFVFAAPSLSVKPGSKKKGKDDEVRPSAFLRIEILPDGSLATEAMPGFRDWLVGNVPMIAIAAANDPDRGGLNIEGLGWDPDRKELLLGVRTPTSARLPMVVPIRLKSVTGPWDESNLEAQPSIRLQVDQDMGDQGVRGMARGPDGKGFLVSVGNATSDDRASFAIYYWDGNPEGRVKRLPFVFGKKVKPEGLTVGTVGGKPSIVIVDDEGGFQVVPLDSLPASTF